MQQLTLDAPILFPPDELVTSAGSCSARDREKLRLAYEGEAQVMARTNLCTGYAYINVREARATILPDGGVAQHFTLEYGGEVEGG